MTRFIAGLTVRAVVATVAILAVAHMLDRVAVGLTADPSEINQPAGD